MAAAVFKVAALAVFLAAALGVSAQTHHVVGGWGPDLDLTSWLSGRVFTVGDKIWFKNSGVEDTIVEVSGLEEFISCNLTNPIRMYTEPLNHVVLEKQGTRYFTSGNPDMCKNGLKLPIPVNPSSEFEPGQSFPPFDPSYDPSEITPPFDPSYDPSPPFEPYPPVKPTPPTPPHEPPPVQPPPHEPLPVQPPPHEPPPFQPPPHEPPPVQPPPHEPPPVQPPPSAAPTQFTVVPFVVSAGLLVCYCLGI